MADYNAPRPGEQGREDLKHASDEARRAAGSAYEMAKSRAQDAAHQARERVEDEATRRKEALGDEAGRLGKAFRAGREELEDGSWQARAFDYAADMSNELSDSIKKRGPGELASSVSDFGRRNPALFIGVAALAGFAFSRLATARAPHHDARTGYAGGGYPTGYPRHDQPGSATSAYGTYDPTATRHEPGKHTMPLTPSQPTTTTHAPTYTGAPTYPGAASTGGLGAGSPRPTTPGSAASSDYLGASPRPTTPSSAASSDPLSASARPLGGAGETKKEV